MKKPKLQIQLDLVEEHGKRLADATTRNKALFLFGPTGVGKSLILKRAIGPYVPVQDASKVGVLDTLRKHPTGTILLDDDDHLWTDVPTLNVFKAALAERDARIMHVNRQTLRDQTHKIDFSGRIVTVSNTETDKLPNKYQPHLEALTSRATTIHLTRVPLDLLEFLDWRVCECDHFRSEQFYKDTGITSLGLAAAQDVLDFVHEFAWRLPAISLRTLNQIAVERKLYADGWHDRALALLRDNSIFAGRPPTAPTLLRWNERQSMASTPGQSGRGPTAGSAPAALKDVLAEPPRRPHMFRKAPEINDVVYTSPQAAERIVRHFKPSGRMLDPCRGLGAFYDAMRKLNTGTVDWCEITEGRNFLGYNQKLDWIITNTPWSSAAYRPIMRHALSLADNVVFLIRLQMSIASTARMNDEYKLGHGQKESVIMNWGYAFDGHVEMGYPLAAVHWQRGWKGGITKTDWRLPAQAAA